MGTKSSKPRQTEEHNLPSDSSQSRSVRHQPSEHQAPSSTMPVSAVMGSAAVVDRVRGALWGIFIADALSMPVHWYYNVDALKRDFGRVTDYQPPKTKHPSSIMNLSNTGGHGRGGQSGRIIGEVINHGKHVSWGKPNMHYHQGMAAGENTLNALCARVVMRGVSAEGGEYSTRRFLSDYVSFMTTPGTHNDTYAESYHRDFFKRWSEGVPPEKCSEGTEGHNTASIGGFVTLPPVMFSAMARSASDAAAVKDTVRRHLKLTHDSSKLATFSDIYCDLMLDVVRGADLRSAVSAISKGKLGFDVDALVAKNTDDTQVVGRVLGSACYIDSSFPVVLYLASKHAGSFEDAVVANTNAGGENCHRGAALGALMGAALGEKAIPPRLLTGLAAHEELRKEIDSYVSAVFPGTSDAKQEL